VAVVAVGPLFGRSAELDELRTVLGRAGSGTSAVAFVEGEAGIGKSRVLVEAATIAESLGFQVFLGTAEELALNRPLGPIIEALELDPDATDLARRDIAQLLRGDVEHARRSVLLSAVTEFTFRVVDDVIDIVENLTRAGPVLLGLDDLQWADQATLLTILGIARRLDSVPVAVIATFRASPRRADLDRVIASVPDAVHLALSPLAPDAVAGLVERMLAAPPGGRLLAEVAGGGGNPLYVTELVQSLIDEGDLDWSRGSVEMRGGALPHTLRLTILRRLGFLPPRTLELLNVAAVLGRVFSLADLSVVLDTPTVQLLPDLQEAVRSGVLGAVGDRKLAFRHDLLREVVYQDLPLPVRVQLHGEVGRALAWAGAPVAQVAFHLGLAAEPGDVEAIEWLARAADDASATAPASAVEFLNRALELAPTDADTTGLRAERARLLVWAGRVAEGADEARALLDDGVNEAAAADLHSGLALALLLQGRVGESVREIEMLTGNAELAPDVRTHLMAEAALGRLLTGDRATAVRDANVALALSLERGDELTCSIALSTLAWASQDEARIEEAIELATAAVDHATRAGPDVVARYGAHYFLGAVLTIADRFDDALAAYVSGRAAADAAGAVTIVTIYQAGVGMLANGLGHWDDARAELEAGIAIAEEMGSFLGLTWHWSVLAQIALHRGELDRAVAALDRAEAEMLRVGPQVGVDWMMWTRALCVEAENTAQAFTMLCNCWDLYAALGVLQTVQTIGPDLARLAVAAGDGARASAVAQRSEEVADLLGTTTARVAALRCRAWADNDVDAALAALDLARTGVRPLDTALACEEAGLRVRDVGRRADAVPLLEEALSRFEQLGAAADSARVLAGLKSVGSRRRARAPARPTHGWDSLTRSELAVVELVAKGLTNRQIALQLSVSRRTVETHLSHVFAKLGIASRVELATAATRNT
jgi:DNA-binding CsgD family transcriptional regulator